MDPDTGTADGAFPERCRREIHALHDFFGAWYRGESGLDFDRVERALAAEFALVTPEGRRVEREPLLESVRADHGDGAGMAADPEGERPDDADPFAIEARDCSVVDQTDERCLLTYEEHHAGPVESARTSAAWFAPDDDAPNGVAWLFVHETWLPDGAPDSGN